jgi:TetR/AcrR family transcriptional repressor of nem operon
MHDLCLTHGGFYRHFGSKEELFIEAFGESLKQLSHKILSALEDAPPGGELKALISRYLSVEHSGDVAGGCPVAALATEVARRPPKTRAALLQILKSHMAQAAKFMPGATEEERERKARVLFSGMAGTLNIARVIVDEHARRQFLEDAKKFYLEAAWR